MKNDLYRGETYLKIFIIIGILLTIVVAALVSGNSNTYAPKPFWVASSGFVLIFVILITALFYNTQPEDKDQDENRNNKYNDENLKRYYNQK